MAIMAIVFAAIVPQFRIILNSWDSKAGAAEALQNGRVLMDHISRNLSKAKRITVVSASTVTNGYIQFIANDSNTYRYDIGESNYVEFGPQPGTLSDLAGPVSSLQFACYDGNNFTNAITDGNSIRFVDVNTTLTNLATLGQDKTFTASVYLRTGAAAPGQASNPNPPNSATDVSTTATLSWTAGSDATSHDVYFGTVSPGTLIGNQAGTTYNPGTMANSTTYYWRIDEKNAGGTTTGVVWSFTTIVAAPGQATSPSPANAATGVSTTATLSWTAGSGATSHDVYFGTTSPGTLIGNQAGTTYNPGTMANSTTYYWRIDEKNAGGTTTGVVWSFTTAAVAAAPTYQAVGPLVGGTGAQTVVWPTHQSGDVALLLIETANQAATPMLSTPAGFVEVTNSPQGTGTAGGTAATRLAVYWKRATTSAEASPRVADSGDHQVAIIITFRGVIASGNPWDVTAGNVAATASTSVLIPGATTTVANTLVVAIVCNGTDTSTAQTSGWTNANLVPTSLTERADGGSFAGNGGGFGVATGVKETAGAYGATTATLATSSVQGRMSIALKP
jgi:hypothetical protein